MEKHNDRQVSAPDSSQVGNVARNHSESRLSHDHPAVTEASAASQSQTKSKPRVMLSALWGAITGPGDSGEDKKTSFGTQQVKTSADSTINGTINGSIYQGSTDHDHQPQPPLNFNRQPRPVDSSNSHGSNRSRSSISTFKNWVSKTVFQHPQQSPKHQSERDLATGHSHTIEIFECADRIEKDVTTYQNATDSLKQALSKIDELHARHSSSIKKISKLENELKEVKKLNQLLTERLEEKGISEGCKVGELRSSVDGMQDKIGKMHEQQRGENLVFELSKKDEEIRILKEKCETRFQQIKILEKQKAELCEQAKHFEAQYHLEMQETQSLKAQIQRLKDQVDALSSVNIVLDEDNPDKSIIDYRKAVYTLNAEVKRLNEDNSKLQDHSKDQSRQILQYKQQAEVTKMMEDQMESMEGMQHEAEEECEQLRQKLKNFNKEVKALSDEKKSLERQVRLLTEESSRLIRYQNEVQDIQEKYSTAVSERDNLEKSLQSMGDLSARQAESERITRSAEKQLNATTLEKNKLKDQVEALTAQNAVYRSDFEAERRDREQAHSQIADIQREFALYKGQPGHEQQRIDVLENQLAEHQQALSTIELVNQKLHQEVQLEWEKNQRLEQDMQAKSSQVKQYAKEVDRLKQQLGVAQSSGQAVGSGSVRVPSLPGNTQLYKTLQEDEQLSSLRENFELYNQVEELKRANAHLMDKVSSLSNKLKVEEDDSGPQIHDRILSAGVPHKFSTESKGTPSIAHQACGVDSQQTFFSTPLQATPHTTDGASRPQSLPNQHAAPEVLQCHAVDNSALQPCLSSSSKEQIQPKPLQSREHTVEHEIEYVVSDLPCQPSLPAGDCGQQHVPHGKANFEDNTAQYENPLQKELDDEIHQEATDVIQEVSRGRQQVKTDLQRPFDPNLVCPMCRRQFRIGEIQKFRRHVNTCAGTDDD